MAKGLKIVLGIAVGLIVLYTVVGFWAVPWAITNKLPPMLTEELNRPVSIHEASFNPFLFKLQIKGFAIEEADGSPLVGFDELFVDFEALSSVSKQIYTFAQIRFWLPYGVAIVRPDGSLNLAELGSPSDGDSSVDQISPPDASAEESAGLPPVYIENFEIHQGMVEFQDRSLPTPFVAHIVPINYTLEHLSTEKGHANPYSLSAERGEGEMITWEGTLTLEPFESEGTLVFENLRLRRLWAYVQDRFQAHIPQGFLTVKGHYHVSTTNQGLDVLVDSGNVTVRDLQIQRKGTNDPLITIPLLEVTDVSVDVLKKDVNIPAVKARDARFVGWVDKDGTMNYQTLFAPAGSATDSPDTLSPPVVEPEPAKTEAPWTVMVEDIDLENFTIEMEDRQPATPARLLVDALHFHTSQVSSALDQPLPIDLSFRLNQTGQVDLKGSVDIEPLSVQLNVSLADIALKPFQPYLAPFVQFEVGSGALTLRGKTHFQNASKTEPMVTFAGSIGLSKFALVDPESSKPFLRWHDLAFKDLALNIEPTTVKVKEIALLKPAVVVAIDSDGSSNLKRLFAPPGQADEQPIEEEEPVTEEPSSPSLPIQIETVRIDNLQLQLADRSITPNVVMKIEEFSGTIKGLSSEQLAKADVNLAGKIDRHSPFRIQGKINPLSEDAYTDVRVSFKNLALTTASPYSGKFAGYPIKKGKLSLDLAYKLSKNELVGENKVLVDQITMGSRVESPDATSLPIPLALALLKDRKGQINIDLPVRGNLDDPDFSYGGIIWNALGNLIVKVATSPFSIIGGLIGGDADDLQFVAFPAGAKEISPAEQEKLAALGKALADRPGLRLDITGAADSGVDGNALAEAKLLTRLKKAKFVQQPPSGEQAAASVKLLELTKEEEAQYLKQIFVETFGVSALSKVATPPTQNSDADSQSKTPKVLTVDEMKAKLLEGFVVDDGQLRILAQQRAQQVREYLIQEGKVPSNQVFLVEVVMTPETEDAMVRSPLALTAN